MAQSEQNKAILERANAAIMQGDNEGFLAYCTEDTEWHFVGDKTLRGKDAVRQWMVTAYAEPPKFKLDNLIAEGEFVTAIGTIRLPGDDGKETNFAYCDVWRFRDGKMAALQAFVIQSGE